MGELDECRKAILLGNLKFGYSIVREVVERKFHPGQHDDASHLMQ